ncbi:MAG: heavy metal translocating P-type ATPase [Immundisolibacter sp.]|uniref:heavy metal translocating P-type ATPase n=1 Tax=Immundisolibacter sp. TaxID=1934948 RepID=UPI003D103694
MTGQCFHCHEPLPPGIDLRVLVAGEPQPVCCRGCQAVAELILAGHGDYYRFRTAPATRPAAPPDGTDAWAAFDRREAQAAFVQTLPDGRARAGFVVEGLRCAACAWLIEHHLAPLAGVDEVRVSPATGRVQLTWRPDRVPLSALLAALAALGYRPHPLPAAARDAAARERQRALKQLLVAGLGMMQVSSFAFAFYVAGDSLEPAMRDFLRLISMLVALPVLLYAGAPFIAGAVRGLRHGRPGMDLPVALALALAGGASVWISFFGGREVYFDSVVMFVFFLSVSRWFEADARARVRSVGEALAAALPASVLRLTDAGPQPVAVSELAPGDRVLVGSGDVIPADGVLVEGRSEVDEALLTGEAEPRPRAVGDALIAGAVNLGAPVTLEVQHTGAATQLSQIAHLLERAQAERPPLALAADRLAQGFITLVLLAAAATGAYWWHAAPAHWLPNTLAVLVVSCPCALALATPTAFAAAAAGLARRGLLVTRGAALQNLARAGTALFDKTGTLTQARAQIATARSLDGQPIEQHLATAAALELGVSHPYAQAFTPHAAGRVAQQRDTVPGAGVRGVVDGQPWRLGRPDFAGADNALPADLEPGSWIGLGDGQRLVALFRLHDPLRADAADTLAGLDRRGLHTAVLSGDAAPAVAEVAARLGVTDWQAGQTPQHKLAAIRARQQRGERVLMVGDGINDAPVLAGADVSVAMGGGAALAQTQADCLLLGGHLAPLLDGIDTARRTLAVVRQNLAWAALYNLLAMPAAAAGLVAPWQAALGMSLSSALVVGNSLRLLRAPRAAAARLAAPQLA